MTQGDGIFLGKGGSDSHLLLSTANRHGMVAGATGTGKTATLRVLAEGFSRAGVPVFAPDIKGDLAGLCMPAEQKPFIADRLATIGNPPWTPEGHPVVFWDLFGELGHPLRATVSEMGPTLLARMLQLNDTQEGVLNIVFRIADEQGLLLVDLKDLRAMLVHVGENADSFTLKFGNIAAASIGAIQRALLTLENQGGDAFFGEPALDLNDLLFTDETGRGAIHVLAAEKLFGNPKLYATFLLWMLSELFEQMPEVGDLEKPKLVFFFDEAHLLFDDAPKALVDKVEQVVRLIRSKGVGVYFISQSPLDVPDDVLGQLGNKVQHALRAFTPRDQKAVKTAATTMRPNPRLDIESSITELGVGEALLSFLDPKGSPTVTERAFVLPPASRLGPATADERRQVIAGSPVAGHYEQMVDRESAYEKLRQGTAGTAGAAPAGAQAGQAPQEDGGLFGSLGGLLGGSGPGTGRSRQGVVETAMKSVVRQVGSEIGRQLVRGVLGSLMGGTSRRR
jgi:DNA helicase HerA-like ATPase